MWYFTSSGPCIRNRDLAFTCTIKCLSYMTPVLSTHATYTCTILKATMYAHVPLAVNFCGRKIYELLKSKISWKFFL